jgi:hypothetical protein
MAGAWERVRSVRISPWLVVLCLLLHVASHTHAAHAPIQIAFGIMTYQKKEEPIAHVLTAFNRLMDSVYSRDNHLYIMHVDSKSGDELVSAIHVDFCDKRSANCLYIRPRNVGWGAPTVVEMNMALLQAAVEYPHLQHPYSDVAEKLRSNIQRAELTRNRKWDYFILLGHEAVALVTLPYIEQFLSSVQHGQLYPARARSTAASGNANDKEPSTASLGALSVYPEGTNFINCWHAFGHDFYSQWEDVVSRMETPVIDSYDGKLIEPLYWQAKNGRYYELKRAIPKDLGFEVFKTIQYVALTPDAVRYIIYGPETTRILLYLANVKASDELVIPTIFQRNATLSESATCDNTLHFMHWARPGGSWHPEYLTMEHLPLLMNTTKHLFIRKVSDESAEVLEALSEVRQLAWSDLAKSVTVLEAAAAAVGAGADIEEPKTVYGVNNRGLKYHIQPAKPITPLLLPPIQQPLVMSALEASPLFMRRCIHHIVTIAVTNEGDVWPAEGSVEEKATNILKQIFPNFHWVDVSDSGTHKAAGNDPDEVKLQLAMQRLASLQEFWSKWSKAHPDLTISHLSIQQALSSLNELRVHRDAIQEKIFVDYWTERYRQEREQAKKERELSRGEEL